MKASSFLTNYGQKTQSCPTLIIALIVSSIRITTKNRGIKAPKLFLSTPLALKWPPTLPYPTLMPPASPRLGPDHPLRRHHRQRRPPRRRRPRPQQRRGQRSLQAARCDPLRLAGRQGQAASAAMDPRSSAHELPLSSSGSMHLLYLRRGEGRRNLWRSQRLNRVLRAITIFRLRIKSIRSLSRPKWLTVQQISEIAPIKESSRKKQEGVRRIASFRITLNGKRNMIKKNQKTQRLERKPRARNLLTNV